MNSKIRKKKIESIKKNYTKNSETSTHKKMQVKIYIKTINTKITKKQLKYKYKFKHKHNNTQIRIQIRT